MNKLQQGQTVTLIPIKELRELFDLRNFFSESDRDEYTKILGGKKGIVNSIENKYAFDYFYFKPEGMEDSWTVPYQAIVFPSNNAEGREG